MCQIAPFLISLKCTLKTYFYNVAEIFFKRYVHKVTGILFKGISKKLITGIILKSIYIKLITGIFFSAETEIRFSRHQSIPTEKKKKLNVKNSIIQIEKKQILIHRTNIYRFFLNKYIIIINKRVIRIQ